MKALRGLIMGWTLGLLGGLAYLLPTVLSGLAPHLVYDLRRFLLLAFTAVPLAALGASLALWVLRLGRLPWGARALTTGLTALALGGALAAVLAFVPRGGGYWCAGAYLVAERLPVTPILVITLLIAGASVWACRWLEDGAEVRGPGRG